MIGSNFDFILCSYIKKKSCLICWGWGEELSLLSLVIGSEIWMLIKILLVLVGWQV